MRRAWQKRWCGRPPGAWLAAGLLVGAGGAAWGDETRPAKVHATATVEVIDDARRVDDIISRLKTQAPAPKPPPTAAKTPEAKAPPAAANAPQRPSLPEVSPEHARAGERHTAAAAAEKDKSEHRDVRRDRDRQRIHRR
jgi:hypothetical protein